MIKTIINAKKTKDADVVFLLTPYEKTASSRKGTSRGPDKIIACLDAQIEFFSRKFRKNANDFIKIGLQKLNNLEKLSPEKAVKKIEAACENLLAGDKFIFLLGGEHSVSVGHLLALTKKYNPKDVTILQIDAHCDLRDNDGDYSEEPSSFAHSAVMRRASGLDYPIVQVGIRTYAEEEYKYFSDLKNKITVFEWGNNIVPKINDILSAIKTKYLYISIDVDGFDPGVMPGTGTPVQGGLEWWYGLELIEKAIERYELVGADIVEVSPMKDSVLTEYGAADLAYQIIVNKFLG
ncbi:agmatinase [Candidatus Nomurabacteria bacterium RIFCSPLOWO2_12_FULL_46_14]|uniref:Agmatinase n=1 Tax=Candidatus Nomurabacteria bacterium RIFCSPLOWO2_12_FULL_46_14 TaxID=1801797 RepID=A0A1F6Y8K6_9BACT|nr:MAG: agmatinase [Candidatus Nomurabacteria bacterium RIFCSPLOWO2_12_FULL_46_14]